MCFHLVHVSIIQYTSSVEWVACHKIRVEIIVVPVPFGLLQSFKGNATSSCRILLKFKSLMQNEREFSIEISLYHCIYFTKRIGAVLNSKNFLAKVSTVIVIIGSLLINY